MAKKFASTIIIVILIIAGLLYFGNMQQSRGAQGVTVLSISSAKIVNANPDIGNKDSLLVNVVANKGGESLVGKITSDDLKRYGIDMQPGEFEITFNVKKQTCSYNVIDDNRVLMKMYETTASEGCLQNDCPFNLVSPATTQTACKSGSWSDPKGVAVQNLNPGTAPAGGDCTKMIDVGEWCYWMPESYLHNNPGECFGGDWRDGNWYATNVGGVPFYTGYKIDTVAVPDYTIEVVLKGTNGETKTATLTPKQAVADLGDVARVKLAGSLIASQFCPVPAVDYAVIKSTSTNKVQIVDKNRYNNYKNVYDELAKLDINQYKFQHVDPGVSGGPVIEKLSTLNNFLTLMSNENLNNTCAYDSPSMKINCKTESDVVYPELQLIVDASWIGVKIPDGKPKILDVKVPTGTVYEGETKKIDVIVQNVGIGDDSFDINLVCDGAVLSLKNQRVAVKEGATETTSVYYSGEAGNFDCKITAASVNSPTSTAEWNLKLNISKKPLPEIIIPGATQEQQTNISNEQPGGSSTVTSEKKEIDSAMLVTIGIMLAIIVIYIKTRKKK